MNESILNNFIPWKTADFYNYLSYNPVPSFASNISSQEIQPQQNSTVPLDYVADIPITLAKSMEGKYFVGAAEDIEFGGATNGWARLYNPPDSGVNLYVNTWTVSDITSTPFRVQIWFNSNPPGIIQESEFVTTANTAITPIPLSKINLQYGVGVKGFPVGGSKAFSRNGLAGTVIVEEEQGKFIFPPGGSFTVFLSNPEKPTLPAIGRIAFGWWEEPTQ